MKARVRSRIGITVVAMTSVLGLGLAGSAAPLQTGASRSSQSFSGPTCNGLPATLGHLGTAGDDVLIGTPGPDVMIGLGGNDNITGLGGDDTICGGDGNDIINGGDGNDVMSGDAGDDQVNAGDGNDVAHGGPGADMLNGGRDDDHLFGDAGNDTLVGDRGNDTMFGGDGDDSMYAGQDNDFLDGGNGADTMTGDGGDDTLLGRAGPDILDGGAQHDTCDLGPDGSTKTKCENQRPQATNQNESAVEDGPPITKAFATTDPDGDPVTYGSLTQPSEGSVVNNGNGTFTFNPGSAFQDLGAGKTRTVSFTYIATDTSGAKSDVATVFVTVTGVNDLPVANADTATTNEDTSKVVNVLANDTDVDSTDVLSVSAVDTTGTTGTVTNNSTNVTYNPNGQFEHLAVGQSATDTFSYTAFDGNGGSATATVTVTVTGVNDAPVAQDVSATVSEDGPPVTAGFDADDVDSDDNPGSLTYSIVAGPAAGSGSVINNNDGTFTFDPGTDFDDLSPAESRDATFTYRATDFHNVDSNTATVTVTVTGEADQMTAVDDSYSTDEDSPLSIAAPGLLGNDIDPDGDATVVAIVGGQGALGGGVDLATDGSFTYDPDGRFESLGVGDSVDDTFTYTATNGVFSSSATVTVTVDGVNDAPTANAQTVAGSGTFTITLTGADVDAGDDLDFTVSAPALGSVTELKNSDGTCSPIPCSAAPKNSATVRYTAPAGEPEDSFTFTVDDQKGGTATATVIVNQASSGEPPQDPPDPFNIDAADGTFETNQNEALVVQLKAAADDTIGDLTFSIVTGPPAAAGSLSGLADSTATPVRSATVTFTPANGFTGTTTFVFKACEVADPGNCDSGTITVIVAPAAAPVVPVAPTVTDLNLLVEADDVLLVDLSAAITTPSEQCEEPCDRSRPAPSRRSAATQARTSAGGNRIDSVTDPAGDAATGEPDLVSMEVGVTGATNNVAFAVKFAPSTFNASTSRATVVIDTDRNPATGFPGIDAANNDSAVFGTEYLIEIGANLGANAQIKKWVTGNTFTLVGTVPVTVNSDGYYLNFDLGLLGGDDGIFRYKVVTQRLVSPTPGFTGIQDYMPNLGAGFGDTDLGLLDGPLVYTVLSLPATGSLSTSAGDPIATTPFALSGAAKSISYNPNNVVGNVSFTYQVKNSALLTTIGTVFIDVTFPTCLQAVSACDDGR